VVRVFSEGVPVTADDKQLKQIARSAAKATRLPGSWRATSPTSVPPMSPV